MKQFLLAFAFLFSVSSMIAQTPAVMNSADILLAMKKLKVTGSVLYIAAHPDDENTRLLAYLSKERLYRTGYLSITRGDGGQNLIGDEQGVELGLIRTQELLAARRIDGAEQFFTRAYDFGFSKSTDEALRIWNKEKILGDVVWVIRTFQPDVIITRFPPDSRAGHGHHSASAVLAQEAFVAAADPNRYPEQFAFGVKPWKAKRILWNTFNFGSSNTTAPDQMKLNVGVFNPLLGKSYGELASESRSQHKSQGFGVARQRGEQFEFFTHVNGDTATSDFMEAVPTNWSRVPGGAAITKQIEAVIQSFSIENPSASLRHLISIYRAVGKLPASYWKDQKLIELVSLIEACAGLYMEATSQEQYAVRGDSLHITTTIVSRSNTPVQLKSVFVSNQKDTVMTVRDMQMNQLVRERFGFVVAPDQPLSQPYWLQQPPNGSFTVSDQRLIGKAENEAPFSATFMVAIGGETFSFQKPVQYRFTDPVKGEIYWPLAVMPAVSLEVEPKVFVSTDTAGKTGFITLRSFMKIANDALTVKSQGTNGVLTTKINNAQPGSMLPANTEVAVPVQIPGSQLTSTIRFWAMNGSTELKDSYHEISYDHIPRINFFDKAEIKSFKADVKITGKKIGYIKGAGDKVAEAMQQMGYEVQFLDEKNLTPELLQSFHAVVTGVRAYNVHPWLSNAYDLLMQYVKQGGVLLVQYNTSSQIGPIRAKISPFPFTISRNRVTEENTGVRFLAPGHPVLNYPNKITGTDFEGWVQERSVYEADQLDAAYTPILGMNDAGEPERKGSLVVADYGKGRFIYTGLALFRQLPAGVPGAYRLLANLLAAPQQQ